MTSVDAAPQTPTADLDSVPAGKPMSESRRELSRVIWRANENMFGSGKGTIILEMIDDVAWATAARHADGHAVTVSLDDMTFISPVWPGDVVSAYAQVEDTGRTSMDIGVYVSARRMKGSNDPEPVAEAHLVFVAVDDNGTPRPVRPVTPETDTEYARHRAVAIRREHRKALARALAEAALPATR
ncbi:acyl-CoA thioesterase [Actinokineospora iranica]|uniref:Acyl-CoA hydrolase n=1 Tax=Actinokineospora iranica TaxID=1271860 RepID=A0A1G6MB32_9PSEU|nr:hotdog domain-containing protein [Actinokineospora iranica]SDC52723.1 Acyl-CoA hydrolase [Actinokineospora iranica]